MRKRTNIINTAVSLVITVGLVLAAALICNGKYAVSGTFTPVLFFLIGAALFGFINAVFHETGHIIACKKNGFKILCVCVWFFKWTRVNKKMRFDFTFIGEEAGYTESIPVGTENMEKRYRATALGGIYASLISLIIGVGLTFTAGVVSYRVFCVLSMCLPVSAYYFFGNALPMTNGGERNDGAVARGIKKKDISMQVAVSLLKIQAELNGGKTPAEIDGNFYFDLPQLPEDDLNFIRLLDARYNYYLDKEDYVNAKKVADRLYGLADDLPKNYRFAIYSEVLYNCCTFDFNEDLADDIMSDAEKTLNAENTATNLRIKLAYLIYVKKSGEYAREIFELGLKRAKKNPVAGIGLFEKKLLLRMEKDLPKN